MACDRRGVLHAEREDLRRLQGEYPDKWQICQETNAERIRGGITETLRGADVCLAFSASGPDIIRPEWVRPMARDPIIFGCANPVPSPAMYFESRQ